MVEIYAEGVLALSACAPAGMDIGEVTAAINTQCPCDLDGLSWMPDPAPDFRDGLPNPGPCDQVPGRTHYLYRC